MILDFRMINVPYWTEINEFFMLQFEYFRYVRKIL